MPKVRNILGATSEITIKITDKKRLIRRQWSENNLGKKVRKAFAYLAHSFGTNIAALNKLAEQGIRVTGLGSYADSAVVNNLITNAGFAGMASRCNGAGSENPFTYLAVGTGTNAAAVGDTTLQTEITDSGLARASATCTRVTTTVTNDTAQLDKTFSVTGTKAVTECGALNAASGGVLPGRQVFTAVNVDNGDSLQITYKFKFS